MAYRIVSGQAPTVRGREAKRKIQRLMHGAAISLDVQAAPAEHAQWHYDLRRGRLHIYGALLRYIDTALAQGRTAEELKVIPRWIAAYIDESADPANTAEIKLVA